MTEHVVSTDDANVKPLNEPQIRELVTQHGAALGLYARQWCRCPEDAVQEALVQLIQLDELPPNPIAWLFRAVRWRAMNLARSEQRRADHQRCWSAAQTPWFDEVGESAIDAREAEKMLAELDELDREIVIARIWGELSFEQIAELVDISTSSVHRRYGHALQRLEMLIHGTVRQVSPSHEP